MINNYGDAFFVRFTENGVVEITPDEYDRIKNERIQWEALKSIKELIELDPSLYNKTLEEVIEIIETQTGAKHENR